MSDTDSAGSLRDFVVEDSNGASTSRALLLDPRNLSRADYWRHVLTAAELIARGMPVHPANPKAGPEAPIQLACVQHLLSEVRTLRAQSPAAWKPGFGEMLEHVDSVRERACTPQRKFLIRGGNPGCMACPDTRERKNQTQVDFLAHIVPYDDDMLCQPFATRWTSDDIVEWSDPETGGLFWHKERSNMGLPSQHFDENRHTPFANYVREVERRRSLFEMQEDYPASVEYMEQWDLGSWFLGKTCLAKMRTTMHLHTFFFELVYDAWISIPEGVNATDTSSLFSVTPDRGQKAEALLAHLRSAVASPKGTKGAKRVGEDQVLWQDVDVYRMSVFADEQGNCKEQEASWMQARAQTLMREFGLQEEESSAESEPEDGEWRHEGGEELEEEDEQPRRSGRTRPKRQCTQARRRVIDDDCDEEGEEEDGVEEEEPVEEEPVEEEPVEEEPMEEEPEELGGAPDDDVEVPSERAPSPAGMARHVYGPLSTWRATLLQAQELQRQMVVDREDKHAAILGALITHHLEIMARNRELETQVQV